MPDPISRPTRIKQLRVSSEVLLNVILGVEERNGYVAVPTIEIPPNTKAVACYPDAIRGCLIFILENAEWPEVESAMEPPELVVTLTARKIQVEPIIHA